jgi:hypothetical protein
MSEVTAGRTLDWEGGSLEELLAVLAEPALSARVEVKKAASGEVLGEVHIVAGGVAETVVKDLRGDQALGLLKSVPDLRFRVEPSLPHPREGTLRPPGPAAGTLAERNVAALMHYCEEFVLTCAVEIRRGIDMARISYRRGEITKTVVNGSEAAERLPDVMAWRDGAWRIVLPQLVLPKPRHATVTLDRLWKQAEAAGAPISASVPSGSPSSGVPSPVTSAPTLPMIRSMGSPAAVAGGATNRATGVAVRPAGPVLPTPLSAPERAEPPHSLVSTSPEIASLSQRSTQRGYGPAQGEPDSRPIERLARPEPQVDMPPDASPAAASPELSPLGRRRRSLFDLPVAAHLLLGLGLGLAIVAAYWLYHRFGGPALPP